MRQQRAIFTLLKNVRFEHLVSSLVVQKRLFLRWDDFKRCKPQVILLDSTVDEQEQETRWQLG